VLTPLGTGTLSVVARIGNETVVEASHMTFNVSDAICPPIITALSKEDIRNPCVCAIGTRTKRAETGNDKGKTGGPECERCPAGYFTLERDVSVCQACPTGAHCFGGAEVLNAAGFWLDLKCLADGISQMSISRTTVFDRDRCPFMKCPGGEGACPGPNSTSRFAQALNGLYPLLPIAAASNSSNRSRASSCPPGKCPSDTPWLSTDTLKCYREQEKKFYYIFCDIMSSSSLRVPESATLPELTSLQCNTGYHGRLCASCSKGYGEQVRRCTLHFAHEMRAS
jgi:hypothetical protein